MAELVLLPPSREVRPPCGGAPFLLTQALH
jgi:hypothetical protein